MITAVLFALGVLLMGCPLYFKMHWIAVLVCELLGIALVGLGGYLAMFKKFFIIPGANEAIVRTGKGRKRKGGGDGKDVPEAPEVAIGYGLWCIPMFHRYIHFKFQQLVFPIVKQEKEALQCADGRLADVQATGKVSVPQTPEAVLKFLAAAGERDVNKEETYRVLTLPTLETSLRDAATTRTYDEVFQGREQVSSEVESSVADDFSKIGVQLDTMKLQVVEPTQKNFYEPTNPQHAVGLTAITVITQAQRLATTTKTLETDQLVKDQEVTTKKKILGMEKDQEFAEADKNREVRTYQAAQEKDAAVAEIQAAEDVAKRGINKEQVVELETVGKDQAIAVANMKKGEAEQTASVVKEQAIELAERAKLIAIAKAEKEKADAEAARALAEQEKEKATQGVITVEVIAKANRDKDQSVIAQEAISKKEQIAKEIAADADAYAKVKDATAAKDAAVLNADATVTEAEAKKQAAIMSAEGEKANKLVPVEVNAREVEIDRQRVIEVTIPELEAKSKNEKIAFELEVQRFRIEADQAIGVALATAMGEALGSANLNVYGGPDTVARIMQSFMTGQAQGKYVAGLLETTPGVVTDAAQDLVGAATSSLKSVGEMGAALVKKYAGVDIDPAEVEKMVAKLVAKHQPKPAAPEEA